VLLHQSEFHQQFKKGNHFESLFDSNEEYYRKLGLPQIALPYRLTHGFLNGYKISAFASMITP
jgi:hypothetical protein